MNDDLPDKIAAAVMDEIELSRMISKTRIADAVRNVLVRAGVDRANYAWGLMVDQMPVVETTAEMVDRGNSILNKSLQRLSYLHSIATKTDFCGEI